MLPGLDGFAVCRAHARRRRLGAGAVAHRARRRRGPRARASTRAPTTTSTKPFSFAELLARLRALARRAAPERPAVLEVDDLRLDPADAPPWRGEQPRSRCARRSSRCSRRFMRRPGQVVSRYSCSRTPGTTATRTARTSSTCTSATCARRSTGPSAAHSIETVRGAGYRLRTDATLSRAPDPAPPHARVRARDGWSCSPAIGTFLYVRLGTRSTARSTRACARAPTTSARSSRRAAARSPRRAGPRRRGRQLRAGAGAGRPRARRVAGRSTRRC